jgi:hypothetical protein
VGYLSLEDMRRVDAALRIVLDLKHFDDATSRTKLTRNEAEVHLMKCAAKTAGQYREPRVQREGDPFDQNIYLAVRIML